MKAKACEHTSYTDVPGTSKYTQISDAKHKKTTLMRRVCDSCKKTLNEYNKEVSESHHFSNGSCKECGAADPNAVCKHKNATNQFAYADITGQGNTQQHIVTDTYKVVCNDCGITIRTYETRRMADHNFNSDGVCSCGYAKPNTCDHANRKTTPLRVTGYVDKGSVGHEKTSLVRVECAECGIVLSAENTVTVVENHDFTYNNTCICGAKGHVHDFTSVVLPNPTYSKSDDNYHTVKEVYRKTCKDCGYQEDETKVRQEKHNLTSKRISDPSYTNVNDNQHKVTAIYQKTCSVCGYQTNETKTRNENHTFSEPTVDSIHDTAKGGHLVTAKCSVCKAEKTFYGALASCDQCNSSGTQLPSTAGPYSCTFTGNHQWEVRYEVSHPHKAYLQCTVCNEKKETDTDSYLPGKAVNCCDCNGHTLGDVYRDKNTHKYYRRCTSCKVYSIEVTPDPSLKAFYEVMDQQENTKQMGEDFPGKSDSKSSSWTHVADKATDKLTEKGFVYKKNGLDAASNMGGTISKAIKDGIAGNTWEKQQIEIWEELIRQMLSANHYDESSSAADGKSEVEATKEWYETLNGTFDFFGPETEQAIDSTIASLETLVKKLPEDRKGVVREQINDLKSMKEDRDFGKMIGKTMNVMNILASGSASAEKVTEAKKSLEQMLANSAENLAKLDEIIAAAKATNNTVLAEAAENIKADLQDKINGCTSSFWDATAAYSIGILSGGLDVAMDKGIEQLTDQVIALRALQVIGKVASKVVNWGEAYDSAEELMTLQVMNANMNIYTSLEKSDSSTMAELWGYLQVKGCDAAGDFLQKYEDANFLETKDFGIGKDKLEDALNALESEKESYEQFIQRQHSN